MNILLIVRWPVGGIKTYLRHIYTHPSYQSINFTIIAPDVGFHEYYQEFFDGSNFTFIPTEPTTKSLLLATFKHAKEADLVHSHGFSSALAAWLPARLRRKKHLMTAHDVFTKGQFIGLNGKIKRYLCGAIFSQMDRIHTVTESAGENFLHYMPFVEPKTLHNIDHGIDTQHFSSGDSRDLHNELNIPKNTLLIGFFGRFMAQKGFRDLIHALDMLLKSERLGDRNIMVITLGYGAFVREDFEYIKSLNLSNHFINLPATNDMPAIINAVDLVAMPSRWEACGLLAMEALTCGTPLVATNCVGLIDVLKNTPAVVVNPYSPEELAGGIIEASTAEKLATTRAYQAIAIERFKIETPRAKLLELYQQMTNT